MTEGRLRSRIVPVSNEVNFKAAQNTENAFTKYPVIPIEFPSPEGLNPLMLYICCRHSMVITRLQLASISADVILLMMESPLVLVLLSESSTNGSVLNTFDFWALNLLNMVVGWTSSIWSCKWLGRLYAVDLTR